MFAKFFVRSCSLALILLLPQLSFAQGYQIPEIAGTISVKPTPGTYSQTANIDKYRNTIVSGDVNGGPIPSNVVITGTYTQTNPSIANATSATLLAANTARKSVIIQNNTGGNICISLNNATITGIVPSSTNLCVVIPTGGSYTSPPNFTNTSAITVYQTSGGATTAISVLEGV